MKRKNLLNKKGFTLIELIVVIAILAILALILVPSITNYIGEANVAKNQANARQWYSEVTLEAATNENFNDTTVGTDDVCTFNVVDQEVRDFSCEIDGRIYSVANGFEGVATP